MGIGVLILQKLNKKRLQATYKNVQTKKHSKTVPKSQGLESTNLRNSPLLPFNRIVVHYTVVAFSIPPTELIRTAFTTKQASVLFDLKNKSRKASSNQVFSIIDALECTELRYLILCYLVSIGISLLRSSCS